MPTLIHPDHLVSMLDAGDVDQNVRDYLAWEAGLLDDIQEGGKVPYRNLLG